MRALTVKQPWASLIASGIKQVENRTYPVPKTVRGQRVAIHAGKGFDKEWHQIYPCTCGGHAAVLSDLAEVQEEICEPCRYALEHLARGKSEDLSGRILCTVRIVGQISPTRQWWTRKKPPRPTEIEWFRELPTYGPLFWEPDAYGWILADVELVDDPRIYRGMLGFWEVSQ